MVRAFPRRRACRWRIPTLITFFRTINRVIRLINAAGITGVTGGAVRLREKTDTHCGKYKHGEGGKYRAIDSMIHSNSDDV